MPLMEGSLHISKTTKAAQILKQKKRSNQQALQAFNRAVVNVGHSVVKLSKDRKNFYDIQANHEKYDRQGLQYTRKMEAMIRHDLQDKKEQYKDIKEKGMGE